MRIVLDILIKIGINAAALLAAVELVPGIGFDFGSQWWKLGLVALLLGVINTYLRPIVRLLALPINLLTMGLVGLVINAGMVLLLALASDQLRLGFTITGWPIRPFTLQVIWAAFLASVVISVVALVLSLAFGQKRVLGMRI
ncbi:MAG: phage holin family protein [Candidatus Limnocylindrales bacterium]|jgi:putative membrane protein